MNRLPSPVRMLAALVILCVGAFAQSPNVVTGTTYVTFSKSFVTAAQSLGLSLGTVSPTEVVQGTAGFPITGGALEIDNAKGEILHNGGLTIRAGSTTVRLQDYVIDTTGASPVITGLVVVDGKVLGRVPLFNVLLPANFTLPLRPKNGILDVKYPKLTLTSTAATALNQVFGTTAFKSGFYIGFARIIALVR